MKNTLQDLNDCENTHLRTCLHLNTFRDYNDSGSHYHGLKWLLKPQFETTEHSPNAFNSFLWIKNNVL